MTDFGGNIFQLNYLGWNGPDELTDFLSCAYSLMRRETISTVNHAKSLEIFAFRKIEDGVFAYYYNVFSPRRMIPCNYVCTSSRFARATFSVRCIGHQDSNSADRLFEVRLDTILRPRNERNPQTAHFHDLILRLCLISKRIKATIKNTYVALPGG